MIKYLSPRLSRDIVAKDNLSLFYANDQIHEITSSNIQEQAKTLQPTNYKSNPIIPLPVSPALTPTSQPSPSINHLMAKVDL
jgi:hypothetical protein